MIYWNIGMVAIAAYMMIFGVFSQTRNKVSAIVFKVVPVLSGVYILLYIMEMTR